MTRTSSRRKSTGNFGPKSSPFNYTLVALMGGIFVLGIGIGIAFSSTTTLSPENVASRDFIDRSAPDPELCVKYGASAMVMDTRLFVTLNPFSVYISQPAMQPGCVLRRNNWVVLEQRNLLPRDKFNDCKNRMNTFAYTGSIDSNPKVNCVYQNDSAENFFLSQPGLNPGGTAPESDRF